MSLAEVRRVKRGEGKLASGRIQKWSELQLV
jgi:hypothetical protein